MATGIRTGSAWVCMALTAIMAAGTAWADTAVDTEQVHVQDCWIRVLPGSLPSAGYFRLRNEGDQPAVLVDIRTDAYAHVMLHATRTAHGMSHMAQAGPVTVPAHGTFDFSPGAYHVMLEQPRQPLEVGDRVALQFRFQAGQAVHADCTVRPPGALP